MNNENILLKICTDKDSFYINDQQVCFAMKQSKGGKMKTIIIFLISLFFYGHGFAASNDIHAKNLQTSVVQKILDYTNVSIKLEVMNYAEPVKVFIRYKALDFGGFELVSGMVSSTFQKYDNKYLTSTEMIKNDVYNRINKWEIGQIDAYPIK